MPLLMTAGSWAAARWARARSVEFVEDADAEGSVEVLVNADKWASCDSHAVKRAKSSPGGTNHLRSFESHLAPRALTFSFSANVAVR